MNLERDFHKVGEFAIPFVYAVTKLRRASDAQEGVTLDAEEVRALVETLKTLSINDDQLA